MSEIRFSFDNIVSNLGVKVLTVRFSGVKNFKTSTELDTYLEVELQKLKEFWLGKEYKDDAVLLGFKDLHERVGRSNRKYPASPELLLRGFLERDRFPRINAVVDLYNLVSLKTRLALGAHDTRYLKGDVTLRLTEGDERFMPLGSSEFVAIPAGEYGYIDDGNIVICRMEVLQVEQTKITLDTKELFVIIQGNKSTSNQYLQAAADELLSLFIRFCGGSFVFLNSPS